jgi:hypothetical protein
VVQQEHRRSLEGTAHPAVVGAELLDDALIPVVGVCHRDLTLSVEAARGGQRRMQS